VILFDTGTDGCDLLHNLGVLELDPKQIDLIFLSHKHKECTGGLALLLRRVDDPCVCFLPDVPRDIGKEVRNLGGTAKPVRNPTEILPGVFSTGRMGIMLREQALVINTAEGLVIVTGCAHPGIVEVIEESKRIVGSEVDLVFGGFHLAKQQESRLKRIVREFRRLGVRRVGPCHCSGDKARELFKNEYGKDFLALAAGSEF
jgi:7,8-dihydropterin-6-yl-methyl-4-(beta-D-ribofuranosyl)aminobenzene 5'-phosphate synthase